MCVDVCMYIRTCIHWCVCVCKSVFTSSYICYVYVCMLQLMYSSVFKSTHVCMCSCSTVCWLCTFTYIQYVCTLIFTVILYVLEYHHMHTVHSVLCSAY